MSGDLIFATHRELNGFRPAPKTDFQGGRQRIVEQRRSTEPRWSEPVTCEGRMIVSGDSQLDQIWSAVCDQCGFEVGIPPRARRAWEAQGAES